ncbi:MAG TPA: hypothetical protein VIH88_11305 [Candidatus Acidoferrales bacterium]
MLTIFSTPKPFHGHIGVIQRNALKSWTLLHPDLEVILFGDDDGAADVCRELGLRHEVQVERGGSGMKRIDYMFGKAQAIARHDVLCYVNCDIVLMDDFIQAVERVRTEYFQFLMVGRRWDTPITEPVEFSDANWREKIRALALSANDQRNGWWIDYFLFSRGLYGNEMPPFVIGTVRWDNWLLWNALHLKLPVVDASQVVLAVHQNHDYNYHPQGKKGVWEGEEAKRNLQLAGGWRHVRDISHATRRLTVRGRIRGTWLRRRSFEVKRFVLNLPSKIWYSILDASYAARHAIGLNHHGITALRSRFRARRSQD